MPSRAVLRAPRLYATLATAALLALLTVPGQPVHAQATAEDWCNARDVGRSQHCEVRQFRSNLSGREFLIDVGPNGSIQVEAWDGSEVSVTARVTARSRNAAAARDLAERVQVRLTGGAVRATGPRTSGSDGWSVSVRVRVPAGVALEARTTNGNISIMGTNPAGNVRTTNGNITIADAAGRIEARSTNGTIRATLAPATRPLEGILIRTTNGSVTLAMPENISARLELSTTNGGITTDMPITVQGRVNRRQLSGVLGAGGPEIHIGTTNGSIRITSSQTTP